MSETEKPYKDPEKLAEARYWGGEKHSYSEMADYLGCSTGTISIWMGKLGDEVEQFPPSEFADVEPDVERVLDRPDYPYQFDFPVTLPTHLPDGTAIEDILEEVEYGCHHCTPWFEQYLRDEFDVELEDCVDDVLPRCPQCELPSIIFYAGGDVKCGNCDEYLSQ